MKESILDVLLYLFEHYFANEDVPKTEGMFASRDGTLTGELLEAGRGDAFDGSTV